MNFIGKNLSSNPLRSFWFDQRPQSFAQPWPSWFSSSFKLSQPSSPLVFFFSSRCCFYLARCPIFPFLISFPLAAPLFFSFALRFLPSSHPAIINSTLSFLSKLPQLSFSHSIYPLSLFFQPRIFNPFFIQPSPSIPLVPFFSLLTFPFSQPQAFFFWFS